MSEHKEPIPSRIYNSAVGGHICGAEDIIDDDFNLEQKVINKEVMGIPYDSSNPNGMGRIILKKTDNFKTVVESQTDGNTIFVIKYDFTLTDNVTIPANCVLEFDGGSISGAYTVTFTNTFLCGSPVFSGDISFEGNIINEKAYTDWFNLAKDGTTSWSKPINNLVNVCSTIIFGNGTYKITGVWNGTDDITRSEAAANDGIRIKDNIKFIGSNESIILQDRSAFFAFSTKEWYTGSLHNVNKNIEFKNLILQCDYNAFEESSAMFNIEDVDGCLIENCKFYGWRGWAVAFGFSRGWYATTDNIIVRNCVFDGLSRENSIAVTFGGQKCNHTIVDSCLFTNCGKYGMPGAINYEADDYTDPDFSVTDIKITNNTFKDMRSYNGIVLVPGGDKIIRGVIIKNNNFVRGNMPWINCGGNRLIEDLIISGNNFILDGNGGGFILSAKRFVFTNNNIGGDSQFNRGFPAFQLYCEDGLVESNNFHNYYFSDNTSGLMSLYKVVNLRISNNIFFNCGANADWDPVIVRRLAVFFDTTNSSRIVVTNNTIIATDNWDGTEASLYANAPSDLISENNKFTA